MGFERRGMVVRPVRAEQELMVSLENRKPHMYLFGDNTH